MAAVVLSSPIKNNCKNQKGRSKQCYGREQAPPQKKLFPYDFPYIFSRFDRLGFLTIDIKLNLITNAELTFSVFVPHN